MPPLRITTCQAENTHVMTAALAAALQEKLDIPVEYIIHLNWHDRYQAITTGDIDLAWICSWPFVYWQTWTTRPVRPLVAPVMRGARYKSQPRYFSDIIVRQDTPYTIFSNLKGTHFAYNYLESQSGHHVVCTHLRQQGADSSFFSQTSATGSHSESIRAVQTGRADAAAIDSTLYDWYRYHHPEQTASLRTIAQLGPSPMPPIIAHHSLDLFLAQDIIDLLSQLHTDPYWAATFTEAIISHFTPVQEANYRPIRTAFEQIAKMNLAQ